MVEAPRRMGSPWNHTDCSAVFGPGFGCVDVTTGRLQLVLVALVLATPEEDYQLEHAPMAGTLLSVPRCGAGVAWHLILLLSASSCRGPCSYLDQKSSSEQWVRGVLHAT